MSVCHTCKQNITGPCINALGHSYHPDHFRCIDCKERLSGKVFSVEDSAVCEKCFNARIPKCGKCNNGITSGQSLFALDKKWHPDCFVCTFCEKKLGGSFVQSNGFPYCSKCAPSSSISCAACNKPIVDRVVQAFDKNWHVDCFTCTVCKKPFGDNQVYEKGGKPFCQEHANTPNIQRRVPPSSEGSPGGPVNTRRVPPSRIPPNPLDKSGGLSAPNLQTEGRQRNSMRRAPPSRTSMNPSNQSPSASGLTANTPPRARPKSVMDKQKIFSSLANNELPISTIRKPITAAANLSEPIKAPRGYTSSNDTSSGSSDYSASRIESAILYKDCPESKLADVVINDFMNNLPGFTQLWNNTCDKTRDTLLGVLLKDLHEGLVVSKKSGPLQVKSWSRAQASLNVKISPQQFNWLTKQIEPMHQNMDHLMGLAYNLSTQQRRGCSSANFSSTVTEIYQIGKNILAVIKDSCSFEVLSVLTTKILKELDDTPTTGEPVQDTLNAAKSALKPMRIHTLVVQDIRNSLQGLRSMSIQLINAIRSVSKGEDGDDSFVILHRVAVDIIGGIKNILDISKNFLSEIATLFALEAKGLMNPQLAQASAQISTKVESDVNIWDADAHRPDWPEGCGTLNSLMLKLTSVESIDTYYQKCFITTYRSFTSPEKLFSKLVQRYNVPISKNVQVDQRQVKVRVAIILKYWFETQIRDFDDMLIQELFDFVNVIKNDANADRVSSMLKNALDKAIENVNRSSVVDLLRVETHFDPISPTDLFFQTSPKELAEQLTLISSSLFRNIDPTELLSQAWSKTKTKHKSPNVIASIQRFNQFTFWVPTMILSFESLRNRSKALSHFIEIAKELRELQNFDGVMGVIAGLTMSPVARLKFSKLSISDQLLSFIDELEASMDPSHSWKLYRNTLRSCTGPTVPYLGVYLTDLTFIEDGNPDFQNATDGTKLINFKKRELVYNVLQEIQIHQAQQYPIEPKEPIASYLRYLPHLGESSLYDISLQREPRNATIKDLIS